MVDRIGGAATADRFGRALGSRNGSVGAGAVWTVLALALGGCGDSAASGAPGGAGAGAPPQDAEAVVALIDFSASQTPQAAEEARGYLEKVVEGLDYGDRLVLLEMYRSGARDSVGRFVRDMPVPLRAGAETSRDRRELEAARRGVLNALPIFFDPELVRHVPTTDLFTTLHMAAEHLQDGNGRDRQVLVLSDMLQSTPDFEFDGARRMPPPGWIDARREEGLLPSLEGACVVVIGADHTTTEGQRVREFWTEYFEAAGATLEEADYRVRAPTEVLACG